MAAIHIPFPTDPAERDALFARATARLARYGSFQGTSESGTFEGRTPVGSFAGTYQSCSRSGMLEINLTKKPFLVPTSLVEHELRRLIANIA